MADAGDEGGYDEEGHREQEAAAEAVAGGEDDDAAAAAEVGEEGDEDGVIDIIDAATGSETQSSENDPMELMGSDSEDGSGEDYSSSGDEEDRELNSQRRSHMLSTMTFDTSVPGHHSYLGETQTATSGIAQVGIAPEGECLQDLPLVSLQSVVLFPGQTLPMTVSRPAVIRAIKSLLEENASQLSSSTYTILPLADGSARRLLLIANPAAIESEGTQRVGTTGEIRSFRDTPGALHLVVLGRQRVSLEGMNALHPSGILTCTARVLPEPHPPQIPPEAMGFPVPRRGAPPSDSVGDGAAGAEAQASPAAPAQAAAPPAAAAAPMTKAQKWAARAAASAGAAPAAASAPPAAAPSEDSEYHSCSRDGGRHEGAMREDEGTGPNDQGGGEYRSLQLEQARAFRRGAREWRGAGTAHWPPWCFKLFDASSLAKRARARFLVLTGAGQCSSGGGGGLSRGQEIGGAGPQNPVDFSYWLSWNMMVSAGQRQRFLECSSTVERLRLQLDILRRMGFMSCGRCQLRICHHEQLFHMSAEGPVSAFVNPGGVVHETATFYKATNLALVGSKSEEHSWFPGYAWTIAVCARCRGHIGWRFTAVHSDSVPRHFWGLSRATLRPVMAVEDDD